MLSGTEATHHDQSLDDIVDTKSVTSYAVTVTDIHGKGVNLPPPPRSADGERDFECPYCYIICPARYGRGRPWRTHILQDLQPYICTYPDCEASKQLFRSRREWNEHEAGHRKVWRCPEHPTAVYRSRVGLEDHLRQQHLDSFPETQLDTIVKIGETSTVEMRERCPICFLPADAEGMGDFANHVANHLERLAAFALPNSSEEDADGASSGVSQGRNGSTASQDASGMSLPNDTSEHEQSENLITELRKSDEEPLVYEQDLQDAPTGQLLLSAESLLSVPDVSQNRLDTLLGSRAGEQDDDDDNDEEEIKAATAVIEEHLERMDSFRAYLLSLPGAQTVRFFKRYGLWRGHAIFSNGTQTAQAVELFDKTLYPEVKIQQGTESNRNKLRFSVQNMQETHWQPSTPQTTPKAQNADDRSTSSTSMVYDDDETNQSKQAVLSVSEIPTLRDMYRSRKLLQRDQSFAPNDSYNRIMSFCYYDLTRMKVDAIVNSANNSLKVSKHKTTLNYRIHKVGGQGFTEEAESKGRLKPGQAALTGGHNLPCAHVIHASRPQYGTNKGMGQFNILTECYRSALKIALVSGFKTVAFPCLGTGGCGFPPRVAARVALQEVREFLDSHTQHPFERIVFVVKSVTDEKAYVDLFPVFFPPTHGDLEAARSSELSANRASLAAQVLETRIEVHKVAQDVSAELSLFVPDFPKEVLRELQGIDTTLASIRGILLGTKVLKRGLDDLNLLCSVMQTVCGSITELTKSAKGMPFSGSRSHKVLWDDYNNHKKMVHGSDLEQFLRDCHDLAQHLDDVLARDSVEPDEIMPMRLRLESFKAQQKNKDIEGIRDHFDEVLYAREFQRETSTQIRDIVRLHQVPSVAQLYASHRLDERPTMVQPSVVFNQTVCLIREDITRLEVTIMVNSTDVTFAGMGTLDRKVFNKGGLELREECMNFGVCNEGDVKLTGSYNLPSKHILHVVPPGQWRKNSKDVLRHIYREILYTAQSLRATSIAIPAIGTGMLNYPRRDCASLAMEEVNRFLETAEPTNLLEKIIFVVYSSNDEFVYKSLLPVYFPPVDRDVNRALPASHPIPKSSPPPPEMISAPRRTLFRSIGDAVRNLGSSRSGKRLVAHTGRAINTYEEHALIGFESHAQDCDICKTMEKLYQDKKDLCEHGYPLAQTLLWYMNLGPDQLVYTRPMQIRQSIRLEVPENMFPLSLTMLRLVEASLGDEGRERPFVSPNRAYSTVVQGQSEQDDESSGPVIYNAETARASVEVWSTSERTWNPVSPSECIIFIRPGKIDVYEAHAPPAAQEPLLAFFPDPAARITKYGHRAGLVVRGTFAAQSDNNEKIMLLSQNAADSDLLLAMLHRANPGSLVSREDLETASGNHSATKADRGDERLSAQAATSALQLRLDPDVQQAANMFAANLSQPTVKDAQDPLEGRLSPLEAKMQKLNETASRFSIESPEQQSATLMQLGDDAVISSQRQPSFQGKVNDTFSRETLTALEHEVLYHLTEDLKSRPGSYIGQSTKDIASALKRSFKETSSATENLAKQGYIHNTINESTWVVSRAPEELPALAQRQHEIPVRHAPPTKSVTIRDATDFQDTPPSPIIPAASTEAQNSPIDIVNAAADLETLNLDESSIYSYDPTTRWTRIDKSDVDPQVLANLDEEFHEDGYSLVIHRIVRRGELKEWVQKTLEFRLEKTETARTRRGVSGHVWLSKGKEGAPGGEERDLHQANLDRVLAGDMREDELRHFKGVEEAEKKRW